jgi:hypothetical protein
MTLVMQVPLLTFAGGADTEVPWESFTVTSLIYEKGSTAAFSLVSQRCVSLRRPGLPWTKYRSKAARRLFRVSRLTLLCTSYGATFCRPWGGLKEKNASPTRCLQSLPQPTLVWAENIPMTIFLIWCLVGIAIGIGIGIVFASFFEWTLHKYVMVVLITVFMLRRVVRKLVKPALP